MINSEFTYVQAGYKAGKAMLQGDAALYKHWRTWFQRALNVESNDDREYIQKLWGQGYSEANPPRKVEYFR
jgi:hypothetical protein